MHACFPTADTYGHRRQDALVLLGPFVDAEHPQVSGGALDVTFEELFATQVRHRTQLDHVPRCFRYRAAVLPQHLYYTIKSATPVAASALMTRQV